MDQEKEFLSYIWANKVRKSAIDTEGFFCFIYIIKRWKLFSITNLVMG